jgi:hypothetical protein
MEKLAQRVLQRDLNNFEHADLIRNRATQLRQGVASMRNLLNENNQISIPHGDGSGMLFHIPDDKSGTVEQDPFPLAFSYGERIATLGIQLGSHFEILRGLLRAKTVEKGIAHEERQRIRFEQLGSDLKRARERRKETIKLYGRIEGDSQFRNKSERVEYIAKHIGVEVRQVYRYLARSKKKI